MLTTNNQQLTTKLLLFFLLFSNAAFAQYTGGSGDGYGMTETTGQITRKPTTKRLLPTPVLEPGKPLVIETAWLPLGTLVNIQMIDALGQVVFSAQAHAGGLTHYPLPPLAQGVYFVRVSYGDEKQVEKMLLLRP